jgi:putative N6-adenine-specific DNA methylase
MKEERSSETVGPPAGTATSSLEKRIRRHLIGKPQRFFAATLPGLETLCGDEVSRLSPTVTDIETTEGGVGFTGRLHDGMAANLHLRTAGRVLLRAAELRATSFRTLERLLAEIPFELYLFSGETPTFSVTTGHCRLYHTDAIAERCERGIRERLRAAKAPPGAAPRPPQTVHVRGVDDGFTLSLDSSGEPLHKRGLKTDVGPAPLRETLAAAILLRCGYTGHEPLLDPLCGSGTFALEAAMLARGVPPGWHREFAFQGWPSFQPGRWTSLRREAERSVREMGETVVFSSDRDPRACERLRRTVAEHGLERVISVREADVFEVQPPGGKPGLVVLNPPYGRRLGSSGTTGRFVSDLSRHLLRSFRGWRYAMLVPESARSAASMLAPEVTRLHHGGLWLSLLTGVVL